jgi:hypothetical protein
MLRTERTRCSTRVPYPKCGETLGVAETDLYPRSAVMPQTELRKALTVQHIAANPANNIAIAWSPALGTRTIHARREQWSGGT